MHDNAYKNQGELIFQGQYLVGIATNPIPQFTIPFNLPVGAWGDHFGAMVPTNQFFNSYEAGIYVLRNANSIFLAIHNMEIQRRQ